MVLVTGITFYFMFCFEDAAEVSTHILSCSSVSAGAAFAFSQTLFGQTNE